MTCTMIQFDIYREFPDANGLWNPIGEGPYSGGLQISMNGSAEDYRHLAAYFAALADRDTSSDNEYHEHNGPFLSIDGKSRLHLICRKDDLRYQVEESSV